MFPSHRTLTKKVLPCLVKCTLEKFVLLYINATISLTTTFDLWMSKGALNIFSLVINFLTLDWEPKHIIIGLFETRGTTGINLTN
jgi:hypothetical protein